MAALMECPSCGEVLAEVGDEDKGEGRGSYRVYDSVANLAEEAGQDRALQCLACTYFGPMERWVETQPAEPCGHPVGYVKSVRICGLCGEQL